MTLIEQAQQELRLLESHWIALLSWLAEKTGVSPDDLVSQWSADGYYRASTRMAAETRSARRGGVAWTVIHFIDFADYVHVASCHSQRLAGLGSPPKNWVPQLNQHLQQGIAGYRNHAQHANRFVLLSVDEQKRALELLQTQRKCLEGWWPDCHFTLQPPPPAEGALRSALRLLSPDPGDALPLVEELGLRPIPNARNLIKRSGVPSALTKLESDLDALYAVGEVRLGAASAAIYLACVREWDQRSARRDPVRRRVTKALREATDDTQRIVIFVDAAGKSPEAEFVLPRVRAGKGVGTVRAAVSMSDPTRHHVQLLESLQVSGAANVPALARKWIEAFSVETVTKRFYEEFRELRDRLIDDLLANNADNPALQRDRKTDPEFDLELHAFGTRQLSRILFLWFLQQKSWLGGSSAGDGNLNFLTDLFRDHGAKGDAFFSDALAPIFFDALGRRTSDPKHRAAEDRFGPMPYLGGGIFTLGANEFEAQVYGLDGEGEPTRRVVLPDSLFDPRKDEADGPTAKGKSRKRTVLGLLRGYRFTTQESTPDDQSIDPDPELLGKVFENLYQADERHATGAYYTPREIVQFMCRRTLDGYLNEQTGATQETLDWLREEAADWTVSDRRLSAAESDALIRALERVRVLDPAVGSGAFLLTMMHEIVTLRRGIEQADLDKDVEKTSADVADWKRRVATDSLYGVDINPMAVEICHLRLWLSIIVDLEVSNYRQIPALPNLDFRIVAGDSLIDRMGEEPFLESLPKGEKREIELWLHTKVMDLQKELDALKNRFTLAEGAAEKDQKRLRDLRQKIRAKQVEIAQVQLAHSLDKAEANLNLLQGPRAKPVTKKMISDLTAHARNLRALQAGLHADAPYQKPFLWPVNFHEVFEGGGFDIVLANPPYIRMENIDNTDEAAFARAFPEVTWTRADLLVYFYARAVQVLREGGQLAFITSNKYMRAAYGAKIREFLPANLRLRQIIDFGDLPLFDAAAYPAVLIGAKTAGPGGDQTLQVADLVYPVRRRLAADGLPVNGDNVRLALQDLAGLLAESAVNDYPQALLRRHGWILEAPVLVRLFDRLMSQGTPLGEFVQGHMYRGVVTGLNDAFVIDEAKRAELIAADPRSAELLKRWLRGRDIRRWKPAWAGLYVIFTRRGTDITEYPAIRRHLATYKDRLERRATAHLHPWYELQQPQEGCYAEFHKPKVVWPRNVPPWECRFAQDDDGSYINDKAYMMPGLEPDVCAYLNSPLVLWLVDKLTTKLQGGWLELKSDTVVARLPVPAKLPALAETGAGSDILLHQSVSNAFALSSEEAAQVWEWCRQRQVYREAMTQSDDDNDDDA